MYLLCGLLLLALGLIMIFAPKLFYDITQKWKNSSDAQPSRLFIFSTRFGGAIFIIVGVAVAVVQFMK